MKKTGLKLVMSLFVLSSLIFIANSCDKKLGETCETTVISGENVEACCTATQCYYRYNGKKYDCNGTDCGDAAQDVVSDILGYKSSANDREEALSKLLDFQESVCN